MVEASTTGEEGEVDREVEGGAGEEEESSSEDREGNEKHGGDQDGHTDIDNAAKEEGS